MNKIEVFLHNYKIGQREWELAKIDHDVLLEIENDFKGKSSEFANSANYFANAVQGIDKVHSVRWRIKDSKHLIRKIVRKRAEGSEKYTNISVKNYHEIVTDLVGIRAIHLFKEDLFSINTEINSHWNLSEKQIIYIREGDNDEGNDKEKLSNIFEIKIHDFGYRSAHYIIESSPSKQKITAELQVRTIFEEGWSEIDHSLRYPNHSDNPDIKSILTIFNRMAGSADEIATFTLRLSRSLTAFNEQLADHKIDAEKANKEKDASVDKIEALLNELSIEKEQNSQSAKIIKQMQSELETIRTQNSQDKDKSIKMASKGQSDDAAKNGAMLLAALAALAMAAK